MAARRTCGSARLDSSVRDGLKILQDTPLPTAKVFAGWKGEGALANSSLNLDIPLAKGSHRWWCRADNRKGASGIGRSPADLTDLRGSFRYDTRSGLSAPTSRRGSSTSPSAVRRWPKAKPDDPRTRLVVDGRVDVDQLARWLGSEGRPIPARGLLGYRLGLILAEHSELAVTSDLRGVTVDLPAPSARRPTSRAKASSAWRSTTASGGWRRPTRASRMPC